ncbi:MULTISPECIES: UDP-3-O-(3-hydroxymyristoyl)glucosamine N-acyltransferase [unclassified Leeuwenhoekiella]|uniref:UDP-3-O-(3-hydroxymyristoyl)glucosamine N-acyltransferase n=1 Tax=unclassified Leeuwenhoekiella TaxID=2615029 RepID=UPI000C5C99EE|nr:MULTISPECIES: UDP-3-O-(3-hydroxymyristoyl)glucosamine N-acyltransferase [unclassified Leeuwenhoekiella]MAW95353.1 UDP-3-O-(3-hydroxymyristoyl)glucosamine N-acyltransferase [Leeuwenhoekiella sp.]MBA81723.1 UDP-3-O-(3-hydroxymyristoyl)glucosamine N-acyltransferase [Leeuwenhoekiella sp.]
MKFPQKHTLAQIAALLNDIEFVGDADFPVTGMNEIHVVEPGDIVFVDHPKYYDKALESAATVVLINKKVDCPDGKALLISDDPFRDFNKLTRFFKPFEKAQASIASSATIGSNTIIQPNAFIGNNVVIGNHCIIHPNVTIYDDTVIGDHVIIHSGTVLGADAFYYKKRETGFDRLLSGGRVVIEDHVELGASCTIDRGVTADTVVGWGSKLDNQVHIGHDTILGKRVLIAAQSGISGCVVIEDDVVIWGQVGIASGITIKEKAVIFAQSGVGRTLEGGKSYLGSPAEDSKKKFREMASIRQIPYILEQIKK